MEQLLVRWDSQQMGYMRDLKREKWILVGLSLKNQPVLQVFTRPIRLLQLL